MRAGQPEEQKSSNAGRQRLLRVAEHHIVFPAFALLLLAIVWGTTWNLIRVQRVAADNAARITARELVDTYEAQVVRALREIDQTLKFVKYAAESRRGGERIDVLKTRGLLLSDYIFVLAIVDARGNVIETTRPGGKTDLAAEEDFKRYRQNAQSDGMVVSLPLRDESGTWKLRFGRRLNAPDGSFAGAVIVSADAAYFASGYDSAKLGAHGMLGLLGTDGIFRVRRTGEAIAAGDAARVSAIVQDNDEDNATVTLATNPWDGVYRYTSGRTLFDFPLVVAVGLAEDEQMAAARAATRTYVWRSSGISIVLLLVVYALWRMSRQLALVRQREAEARIEYAERIEYLAYHDGLTGLPNRSLFSKLLDQSVLQARRHKRLLAVLFLDLDRFKHINDTLGHDAGDDLLKEVASRLKGCLRESDTVARLGGDEFVVLLPEIDDEKYVNTVAQKMLFAIAKPFTLIGQEFRVTVSIGISLYPRDGEDEETLKKHADVAMYHAKEEGKNNFQFYSEDLNANSLERLTLESGLRRALENGEFLIHYQAKRDMQSSHITGVEALLRWQHPDLGMVAPLKFIPVAEETGLILPIGRWVLRTVCQQIMSWRAQGLPEMSVAVNLTEKQFHDEGLLDDVAMIVKETNMEPHLLELEISERMLMQDVERTMRLLRALKAMGVRIAIDDFGIGYSSLAALKHFPIDTIKIDRSLVRDVTSIDEDRDMTRAIIAMGRTLSLMVVAQGVENKEQVDILRAQSCHEFQGFYFNRPLPSDEFVGLLRAQGDSDAPQAAAHEEGATARP